MDTDTNTYEIVRPTITANQTSVPARLLNPTIRHSRDLSAVGTDVSTYQLNTINHVINPVEIDDSMVLVESLRSHGCQRKQEN